MFRRVLILAAFAGFSLADVAHQEAVWAGAAEAADAGRETLPPRTSASRPKSEAPQSSAGKKARLPGEGWWSTLGGLAVVIGLVLLAAKVARKNLPAAHKTLPPEVVQVLGRKALDYRHTVHLVRFGSRLLMVGTSQEGMSTLSEITDPVEIDYLSGLCKPSDPTSVAQSFTQLFHRFQGTDAAQTESDSEVERDAEPEADTDRDASQNSDPAILRLQERLQQSPRADSEGASLSISPEARG